MRHCNWMIKEINSKRSDCVKFIKDNTVRLSEERVLQIHKVNSMNYEQLISFWQFIPASYRSNAELGCS